MAEENNDLLVNNPVRQSIIQKLIHYPGSTFNELWKKDEIESNKFAYHIKQLEEEDLIEKKEGRYFLSAAGKEIAVFLEGKDGSKKKKPLICLLIVAFDGKGKVLLHHRLKEPFYDYYGFPGGKIDFGEEILQAAEKELMEETGLTADLKIASLYNFVTYNNDKLSYHHTQFIIKAENPKGEITPENREGTFEWIKIEDFEKYKLFPDDPHILKATMEGKFKIYEVDRFQKDDEFTGMKIKSEYSL
ncbi:MAG: NUDIX domain-containing protein [Candidatus Woesearchaeota archaeon]